jgi:hypothetical protein
MTQSQIVTTVAIVVVAVAAVGGGLAYAAKDAQPGDMLYGLRASLYDGSDGSDDVEGARAAYDEASSLQASGMLTASEQARISASYSMHVDAVMDRIAELEANGDMSAAAELRADLREIVREAQDLFPESSSSSAAASSDASMGSSVDGMTDSSASDGMTGASSSIFVQPSSSVTSA